MLKIKLSKLQVFEELLNRGLQLFFSQYLNIRIKLREQSWNWGEDSAYFEKFTNLMRSEWLELKSPRDAEGVVIKAILNLRCLQLIQELMNYFFEYE